MPRPLDDQFTSTLEDPDDEEYVDEGEDDDDEEFDKKRGESFPTREKRRRSRDLYNDNQNNNISSNSVNSNPGVYIDDFIEEIMVELSHDLIHHFDSMPNMPAPLQQQYHYQPYPPIYNPLQSRMMMPPMMSNDVGYIPQYYGANFASSDNAIDDDDEIFQQQLLDQMNSTKHINNTNPSMTANANSNQVVQLTTDEETFARGYGVLASKSSSTTATVSTMPSSTSTTAPVTSTLPPTTAPSLLPQMGLAQQLGYPYPMPYGNMPYMPYMGMMGNNPNMNYNPNSDPNTYMNNNADINFNTNTNTLPNTLMPPMNFNDNQEVKTDNNNDNGDSNNNNTSNTTEDGNDNTTSN